VASTSTTPDSEANREPSIAELISFPTAGRQPGDATKETTMHRNHPPPDQQRPGRLLAPGKSGIASPAPGPADLVHRRQLEKSVSWSGRERLRGLWCRLRLTVAEMNYATRRVVELQAPWISDDHPSH
jgi:hypothetical protein